MTARRPVFALPLLAAGLLCASSGAHAQSSPVGQPPPTTQIPSPPAAVVPDVAVGQPAAGGPDTMLKVPVSNLLPGNVDLAPDIKNPVGGDIDAAERGRKYFEAFNCVGCHAPNGAGGMGPALSNEKWLYGSSPAAIYLTIVQGRPNGMPAWGAMLPDNVVWDLVAYIHSIGHPKTPEFGRTTSLTPRSPSIEQVPAQDVTTTKPWDHTEAFSAGQRPGPEGQASGRIGKPNKSNRPPHR